MHFLAQMFVIRYIVNWFLISPFWFVLFRIPTWCSTGTTNAASGAHVSVSPWIHTSGGEFWIEADGPDDDRISQNFSQYGLQQVHMKRWRRQTLLGDVTNCLLVYAGFCNARTSCPAGVDMRCAWTVFNHPRPVVCGKLPSRNPRQPESGSQPFRNTYLLRILDMP